MIKPLFASLSACVIFSASAMATVPCSLGDPTGTFVEHANIQYGTNASVERLDLFTPTSAQLGQLGIAKAAAIVVIHGHGAVYNDAGFTDICEKFASNGIACASIEYPESFSGAAWHGYASVNCALRWLRANGGKYGYVTNKIGIYGGSLGGLEAMWQVAAQSMTETPIRHFPVVEADCPNAGTPAGVDAAVLQYGVADLTIPITADVARDATATAPGPAQSSPAQPSPAQSPIVSAAVELSPITYLNHLIPQIVSVGDYDTTVNPINTGMWVQRLIALGARDIYVDPTNRSQCAIGAICGGQFTGQMQYWDLGGFGHGYQVFSQWPTGPNHLSVPTAYACSMIAFYWKALLGLPAAFTASP